MSIEVFRGDIWLVTLDPTIGSEIKKTRPAMIISNDINNELASTVTVIPMTSNVNKIYPFEVFVSGKISGLVKDSKLKCDQIRTIDKQRLHKYLGKADNSILSQIKKATAIHLGFV